MFLEDILKSSLLTKLEDSIMSVEEDVKFVNTTANKWEVVISFDLDAPNVNPIEREALSTLLKYL